MITTVEEKPADVSDACTRLTSVGKMHRTKVIHPNFIFILNELKLNNQKPVQLRIQRTRLVSGFKGS